MSVQFENRVKAWSKLKITCKNKFTRWLIFNWNSWVCKKTTHPYMECLSLIAYKALTLFTVTEFSFILVLKLETVVPPLAMYFYFFNIFVSRKRIDFKLKHTKISLPSSVSFCSTMSFAMLARFWYISWSSFQPVK